MGKATFFAMNFMVAFVLTSLAVGGIFVCVSGVFAMFHWLAGGAFWGLLASVVIVMAISVALAFAADQARKR
ncbi:MAG: hypothetical protein DI604_33245 [Delftia acidovorans]|nr:MAG: hypothetical protein DI604_33245 [Delftia acidovorans]